MPEIKTIMVVTEIIPRPDTVSLTVDLDGSAGLNRSNERSLLTARTDREAIESWVDSYDSRNTQETYRREAYRLWLWSVFERRTPMSSLTHEDLLAYRTFILDPQPAHLWVSEGGQKFPRDDSRWRPFYRKLSGLAQQQALTVLNVMFSWLVEARYLQGNPLALSRRRRKRPEARVTRYLPPELWQETLAYVEELPRSTNVEKRQYHRARWMVSLFYLTGLRISEAVGNTMGQFYARRGDDGELRWWLEVHGKGDKTRHIPATQELMAELALYRQSYELAALPVPGEITPLVLRYGKQMHEMTRSAAHVAIKHIFEGAAVRLRGRGPQWKGRGDYLEEASAHWLRHTAGSHMADSKMGLVTIRDNLGHENLSTTSPYLHTADDERHKETEAHFRLGWSATGSPQK